MLRKAKVVGKFVEFFGEGTARARRARPRDDRQHGARVRRDDGLLPGRRRDASTTSRAPAAPTSEIDAFEAYFKAQGLFGVPRSRRDRLQPGPGARPRHGHARARRPEAPAGPHRARRTLKAQTFDRALLRGTPRRADEAATARRRKRPDRRQGQPRPGDGQQLRRIGNGDVLIAAITSCTNTSNPSVLLAAGLLAKKAVERGLTVKPHIKTSLAPGLARRHRVPEEAGPAALPRAARLRRRRLRLHDLHRQRRPPRRRRSTRRSRRTTWSAPPCSRATATSRRASTRTCTANFLASPPLVVAFAIAGTVLTGPDDRAARQRARTAGRFPRRHLADAATRSRR